MKRMIKKIRNCKIVMGMILISIFLFWNCQKIEYTSIENPAYLRVFNSLNFPDISGNSLIDTLPYLCMLINPVFDGKGLPVTAEIVGDFLGKRAKYAPPFPQQIGVSTTRENPEYPGKETVLVGPVLNGFDLSSWAQVPAKRHRVVFMYRPKNDVPFFELDSDLRKNIAAITEVNLEAGEVYTLQIIFDDFIKRSKKIILRQETFHKQVFSDSLVYVNFYNYTADNFLEAPISLKFPNGKKKRHLFEEGIESNMDIYLSLMKGLDFIYFNSSYNIPKPSVIIRNAMLPNPSYEWKYFYTLNRNINSNQDNPFVSFPMWVSKNDNGIATDLWQRFYFLQPNLQSKPQNHPFNEYGDWNREFTGGPYIDSKGKFAIINCLLNGPAIFTGKDNEYHLGYNLPNLLINIHSGRDNPKSFTSVNTFEIINGEVYLLSMQRKFAPPIY
ncbi:hypothetical protein [Sphingobacterium humi]|uniref:Uncharacterized protein n=1 Tax=Sphingobacterium humi TaxID=1796905 RepID=A0A6N8KYQ9_9SPHI|nr:hypothetical protein [Sphingobacterium humi]MVZ62585.1 hypothetical protein [Sphingobacterium humi]